MKIDTYMDQYEFELTQAKKNSKVYNGIRYYTFGETYFFHENDTYCEYWFYRVCGELPNPEKYIDTNLEPLRSQLKGKIDDEICTLNETLLVLEKQKKDIKKEIEKLKSFI